MINKRKSQQFLELSAVAFSFTLMLGFFILCLPYVRFESYMTGEPYPNWADLKMIGMFKGVFLTAIVGFIISGVVMGFEEKKEETKNET